MDMTQWKEVGKLIYSDENLIVKFSEGEYCVAIDQVKRVLKKEVPYELIYEFAVTIPSIGIEVGKDCGYLSLSKSGKVVSIVVKRKRYIANLKEVRQVVYGAREFTPILKSVGQ